MNANHRHALVTIAVLGLAQPASADVITDWNEKAVAFVQPRMPPPQGHRATAMVHLAMFDAVNSIERRYRPYLVHMIAAPTTSKEAAAAVAAGAVLVGLLPQARAQSDLLKVPRHRQSAQRAETGSGEACKPV